MALPVAELDRAQRHRVLAGHPWVWRSEIARSDAAGPGALIEVRDARGARVGTGYWNPRSQIAIRLLTRGDEAIDLGFFRARIRAAVEHRARALPAAWPARRLVNSEADRLPGLIVDAYGDRVAFQLTTLGMDVRRDLIVDALRAEFAPAQLIERSDVAVRTLEGLEARSEVLVGPADGHTRCRVGAAAFAFDLLDPHKTGFYLDQQANYGVVAGLVRPGERVLDTFCHLGGFAVHAALAGAAEVLAIDQAEDSVAGARAAAALNGVDARLQVERGDVFEVLTRAQAEGGRWDVIVLDPPAFARSRAALDGALRGYKDLHLRALRMLAPGGRLATFSCSHHVGTEVFAQVITDAAADAGAVLRREAALGASPDHPVLPQVPETEYLKGFVFTVVERIAPARQKPARGRPRPG